jgi:hypothetical protein
MIVNALKQRAEAVINNRSIDAQSRSIIRYALETNDPWLAELVRRAEVGERIADTIDFSQASETYVTDSSEKIEALAENDLSSRRRIRGRFACSDGNASEVLGTQSTC